MAYEPQKGKVTRLMKWFLIAVIAVALLNIVIAYFLINSA